MDNSLCIGICLMDPNEDKYEYHSSWDEASIVLLNRRFDPEFNFETVKERNNKILSRFFYHVYFFNSLCFHYSTVVFAMEGIGVVMPIENEMAKPQHFLGCPGVLNVAMTVVVTLYGLVGLFGYMTFGDTVHGSVTLNLPKDDV